MSQQGAHKDTEGASTLWWGLQSGEQPAGSRVSGSRLTDQLQAGRGGRRSGPGAGITVHGVFLSPVLTKKVWKTPP